jgi:hypothetical protein
MSAYAGHVFVTPPKRPKVSSLGPPPISSLPQLSWRRVAKNGSNFTSGGRPTSCHDTASMAIGGSASLENLNHGQALPPGTRFATVIRFAFFTKGALVRHKTSLQILGAALVCLTLAAPAQADLIVVNPNSFAPGTDISRLFPGVTISTLTQDPWTLAGPPVPFTPIARAATVNAGFGPSTQAIGGGFNWANDINAYNSCHGRTGYVGQPDFACRGGYSLLEMRFDAPTDFVSIEGLFNSDAPNIIVYDINDNPILAAIHTGPLMQGLSQSISANSGNGPAQRSIFEASVNDRLISRIVYGGYDNGVTPVGLSYNVPEPTTLGLMALGLVGLWRSRASRRRA